jgi:hypothetical protein
VTPIKIRLNKIVGGAMLCVAALNLFTYSLTKTGMQLALAGVLALVGTLYLIGEALVVTDTEVQIKNPLGMILRRHPIRGLADLEMDGSTLYVTTGGARKKVSWLGFIATGSDVEQLRQAIADARRAT